MNSLAQAGPTIALDDYAPGQHRLECPSCGRGGRDQTAGLKKDPGGTGVLHCFRCGYIESLSPGHWEHKGDRQLVKPKFRAQEQQCRGLNDWGKQQWQRTQELGGIALQYLQSRHCCLPPVYGDLRWLPSLWHPSGYVGPALVALITDIKTNEPLSLHRTWISSMGKANLEEPRLNLAGHAIKNGCIRFWPDEEVTYGLGIAEGIETALSLALAYTPVWAVIDAGHMARFPAMRGIEELMIAVDNDPAGIAASNQCSLRWRTAGKDVLLTRQSRNDLNDELQEVMR